MQLTPRYGPDPVLTLDGPPGAILEPAERQRRRLTETVAAFTPDDWAHPSRCAGWSNRDVVAHLESVNSFWALSVAQGRRGEPTRFLTGFDPVATPAQLVDAGREQSAAEVFERFVAASAALSAELAELDDDGWRALAETPAGHLTISALTHHALWDSWIHERDVLLPLGRTPDEEPDEILAALRYVAGLGPTLARILGQTDTGTFALAVTDPVASILVEAGEASVAVRVGEGPAGQRLTGGGVELLEALSLRRPLDHPAPAAIAGMLQGLAKAFDADQP